MSSSFSLSDDSVPSLSPDTVPRASRSASPTPIPAFANNEGMKVQAGKKTDIIGALDRPAALESAGEDDSGTGDRGSSSESLEYGSSTYTEGSYESGSDRYEYEYESDDDNADEEPKIKLVMWDYKHCDPRRCSGRKLANLKELELLAVRPRPKRFTGVVLSSKASKIISHEDIPAVTKSGIATIDASWNRIKEVNFGAIHNTNERLLPLFIAANPAHFGRPFELNCVEAYAAALYICGFPATCGRLLSYFNWGHEFLNINAELLDLYAVEGVTSKAMKEVQDNYWRKKARGPEKMLGPADENETDDDHFTGRCEGLPPLKPSEDSMAEFKPHKKGNDKRTKRGW